MVKLQVAGGSKRCKAKAGQVHTNISSVKLALMVGVQVETAILNYPKANGGMMLSRTLDTRWLRLLQQTEQEMNPKLSVRGTNYTGRRLALLHRQGRACIAGVRVSASRYVGTDGSIFCKSLTDCIGVGRTNECYCHLMTLNKSNMTDARCTKFPC